MKRITAIMTTLALILAMVSCKGSTTEPEVTTAGTTVGQGLAPAVTTETAAQTTVMTTVETSVETTAETEETTAAETENVFPEFDINSEECLMYRLMGMTFGEIEAEFGENFIYGGIGDSGNQTYYIKLDNAEYQILYKLKHYYIEGSDSFQISKDAKPSHVLNYKFPVQIYPGINISMTPKDIYEIIPNWDSVEFNNYSIVYVMKSLGEYDLCVGCNVNGKDINYLVKETKGKSEEEKVAILKEYADGFVQNMKYNSSSTIDNIRLQRKD